MSVFRAQLEQQTPKWDGLLKTERERYFELHRADGAGDADLPRGPLRHVTDDGAFCDAFLALPLMWEAIAFDGVGIVMEDSRTTGVLSSGGRRIYESKPRTGQSWNGCVKGLGKLGGLRAALGPSHLGRLALRALLPSYYQVLCLRHPTLLCSPHVVPPRTLRRPRGTRMV